VRRRWKLALAATAVAAVGIALGFVFADRSGFVDRLQYPLRYDALVREQAQRFDLDPALVAAVIYQESRFRPNARSDAGAIGLMQVLPDTGETIARWTGGKSFRVDDLYDPAVNVRYGSWFLHHLFEKYGDETRALAAYHAGETNVDGWIREGNGIAFADTRDYVRRVQDAKRAYRRAYGDRLSTRHSDA
jgi:soluble lytic murein transglycosylase